MVPWVDTRARFVASVPPSGTLLDIGSSDGETLGHIAELRPDLRLYATDLAGNPEAYPSGCTFHRGNIEKDPLPWANESMDGVTCMHLVEHLHSLDLLLDEVGRVLRRGGRAYFETPRPKTLTLDSSRGEALGAFTLNFYDDLTHVRPVSMGGLAASLKQRGFHVVRSGVSRNLLFAAAWPLLALTRASRKRHTARIHWLGWSAYLIASKLE